MNPVFIPEKLGMFVFKSDECLKNNTRKHSYSIIKNTGKQTGTATWKCSYCNKEVKSN